MVVPSDSLAFEALADPTRRTILTLLAAEGETSAGQLAAGIDALSRTAVSSHLRILRSAGLVAERRDGRYRLYSLAPRPVDEVIEFLALLYQGSLRDLKHSMESSGPVEG
jgi:ArsR family transcriptional regulator